MKRVLLILVVLLALAGAAFFLLKSRGVSEGAQLVPADSVLYVTLPDVQRTLNRWPKTALAQIGTEPAVADFLGKPSQQLALHGGIEALDILFRVKPGRLFFAVTSIRETGAQVLVGFQFFGGRKDAEDAMARLFAEVAKKAPRAATGSSDYKGDTVATLSGPGPLLFSSTHGSWGFIANDEAVLRQALDRAAGRAGGPSLAADSDFRSVVARLSEKPDSLWYAKPKPVMDLLVDIGNRQKAKVNRSQMKQLEKLKALGGTLLFDGANQKEVSFILAPEAPKLPAIDRSPMALTTPETSIFFDNTMDLKTIASDDYFQTLPPAAQSFLANAHLDLKQVPALFGSDLGFIMSWSTSAMIPNILVAVEVKDRAGVESFAKSALAGIGLGGAWSDSNGASVFNFPPPALQLVDPVLAVNDRFLLASLTSAELQRALAVQSGAPTLEGSAPFKPALAAYKGAGQSFGYVDCKALFERAYNMLRPVAFLAGMASPSLGQYVDIQKLPDTETISRHLSPIVYTSTQTPDGIVVESSGPITLSQAAVLAGGGAVAAYLGQMRHGLGH